eukprot:10485946-Ditylum_brightwellii.AAC.1
MVSMVGLIVSTTGGLQNGLGANWQNGRCGGVHQETAYGADVVMNGRREVVLRSGHDMSLHCHVFCRRQDEADKVSG